MKVNNNLFTVEIDDRGFLMIDQHGNCVLVKLAYVDTDTFVRDSLRRCCNAKQLSKIISHYRKTGTMIEEDDLQ